jgi:hypothetical protein
MPLAAGDKPGAYEVLAALGAGGMVLIRRLLAKSRDERYPSMAEVRADLGRLSTTSVTAAADDGIPLIGREQEFAELKRALEEALVFSEILLLACCFQEMHELLLQRRKTANMSA